MPTSHMPLVDRLLEGRLVEYLTTCRAEGLSFHGVAKRLRDDHDIDLTPETVRKWCLQLDIDRPDPEAATG